MVCMSGCMGLTGCWRVMSFCLLMLYTCPGNPLRFFCHGPIWLNFVLYSLSIFFIISLSVLFIFASFPYGVVASQPVSCLHIYTPQQTQFDQYELQNPDPSWYDPKSVSPMIDRPTRRYPKQPETDYHRPAALNEITQNEYNETLNKITTKKNMKRAPYRNCLGLCDKKDGSFKNF